jgi:glycosyltransferase involved in cell wall biosynthesis
VVTTNAGGIPYIVEQGQTGLLSETDDFEQLAANVTRLLQDRSLARRLIKNAYGQSCQYHWSAIRKQWLAAYCDVKRTGADTRRN